MLYRLHLGVVHVHYFREVLGATSSVSVDESECGCHARRFHFVLFFRTRHGLDIWCESIWKLQLTCRLWGGGSINGSSGGWFGGNLPIAIVSGQHGAF